MEVMLIVGLTVGALAIALAVEFAVAMFRTWWRRK